MINDTIKYGDAIAMIPATVGVSEKAADSVREFAGSLIVKIINDLKAQGFARGALPQTFPPAVFDLVDKAFTDKGWNVCTRTLKDESTLFIIEAE